MKNSFAHKTHDFAFKVYICEFFSEQIDSNFLFNHNFNDDPKFHIHSDYLTQNKDITDTEHLLPRYHELTIPDTHEIGYIASYHNTLKDDETSYPPEAFIYKDFKSALIKAVAKAKKFNQLLYLDYFSLSPNFQDTKNDRIRIYLKCIEEIQLHTPVFISKKLRSYLNREFQSISTPRVKKLQSSNSSISSKTTDEDESSFFTSRQNSLMQSPNWNHKTINSEADNPIAHKFPDFPDFPKILIPKREFQNDSGPQKFSIDFSDLPKTSKRTSLLRSCSLFSQCDSPISTSIRHKLKQRLKNPQNQNLNTNQADSNDEQDFSIRLESLFAYHDEPIEIADAVGIDINEKTKDESADLLTTEPTSLKDSSNYDGEGIHDPAFDYPFMFLCLGIICSIISVILLSMLVLMLSASFALPIVGEAGPMILGLGTSISSISGLSFFQLSQTKRTDFPFEDIPSRSEYYFESLGSLS